MVKTCKHCGEDKPVSCYSPKSAVCRDCYNAKRRDARAAERAEREAMLRGDNEKMLASVLSSRLGLTWSLVRSSDGSQTTTAQSWR